MPLSPLIPEHFHYPRKKLVTFQLSLLILLLPSDTPKALATANLLAVSMDLPNLFIDVNGIIKYVNFCIQLLWLSKMLLRFIHTVPCINTLHPFLWLNNILLYVFCHNLVIHSSTNGYLTCFNLWATMTGTAVRHTYLHESLFSIILGIYLAVKLLNQIILCSKILRNY